MKPARLHLPRLAEPAPPPVARPDRRAPRAAAGRRRRRRRGARGRARAASCRPPTCERVTRAKLHAARARLAARGAAGRAHPVRRHHRGAGPAHPRQAGRCGRCARDAGAAVGPHAPRAHRGGAWPRAARTLVRAERVARALRAAAAAARSSAYVASGEPFGKAGAYAIQSAARGLDRAHRRQLLRHHGSAAVRDGRSCCDKPACGSDAAAGPETRPAMQDILINWAPQETRVAMVENGAVQELHVERTLERGLVGNIYLGKVARVLPGMQSAFIDIGLERAAFLHVADLHVAGGDGARAEHGAGVRAAAADRAPGVRRPDADGAGDQGPDRHQGRAAVDADQHRRALLVFLPQDDHIGISQKIGSPELREQLRARMSALAAAARRRRRRRRLHPAHQRRGSQRRRTGRRHRLPAQDLGRGPRAQLQVAAGHAAAPGPEPGRARAARPGQRRARRRSASTRAAVRALQAFGARVHAGRGGQARALQGRAADLRPVQHRRRDRPRAGAARRPEVGRLPDHRPDRGADHGRREHRRLRRRAQLRRHDLQDQPRGRAGASRASCACATWAASSSSTSST